MQAVGTFGITSVPPPDEVAEARGMNAMMLAQVICARLCHDLGGPTGALSGALDLLDGAGDDALEVARDAARILDRRLRFWRAAVAGATADLRTEDLVALCEGLTLGRRATLDASALRPDAVFAPGLAQAVMLASWAGVEALPRGGTVRMAGDPRTEVTIWPEGQGANWPQGLLGQLAGEAPVLEARAIVAPLLIGIAGQAGVRVELLHGAPSTLPPLLLTPLG